MNLQDNILDRFLTDSVKHGKKYSELSSEEKSVVLQQAYEKYIPEEFRTYTDFVEYALGYLNDTWYKMDEAQRYTQSFPEINFHGFVQDMKPLMDSRKRSNFIRQTFRKSPENKWLSDKEYNDLQRNVDNYIPDLRVKFEEIDRKLRFILQQQLIKAMAAKSSATVRRW